MEIWNFFVAGLMVLTVLIWGGRLLVPLLRFLRPKNPGRPL